VIELPYLELVFHLVRICTRHIPPVQSETITYYNVMYMYQAIFINQVQILQLFTCNCPYILPFYQWYLIESLQLLLYYP
jgi:hypothetical protein